MKTPKLTARKWQGDDAYSWAIFIDGRHEPAVSGLTRSQVAYYKKQVAEGLARKNPKDERLKRGNVKRMCLAHGAFLGQVRDTTTSYWVSDGKVWQVTPEEAVMWGYYFDFRDAVRKNEIAGFVPAN